VERGCPPREPFAFSSKKNSEFYAFLLRKTKLMARNLAGTGGLIEPLTGAEK